MGYTLVYCVDYGSNGDGSHLSPMGIKTLTNGVSFLNGKPEGDTYVLGYCGADLPDKGMVAEQALEWKGAIVQAKLYRNFRCFPIAARNSIDEAKNTKAALDEAGIAPTRIVLYCEWWHSWRVRLIWRKVFRGCKIEVRTMRWMGGEDYILPAMRSRFKWPLYNMIGFGVALAWVCGWKGAENVR